MQKKLTRKEKINLQQQTGGKSPVKQASKDKSNFASLKTVLGILVALLAFALYSNTLGHEFAFDDYGLIKENTITTKGTSGLKEIFATSYRSGMSMPDNQVYRPLSKAMFAIEWQMAPDNPAPGHWMNVILFALTCLLVFHVLSLFLKGNLLIPFITALLFAAHPIHTEVVANIKSRDEILSLLFCLLMAWFVFRYCMKQKPVYLIGGAIMYFLSLLAKETAVTWLAVIPLCLYFFTDVKRAVYTKTILAMIVPLLLFLFIRQKVLGPGESSIAEIDNYLAGIKDFLIVKTTAIFLMGVYLKLLFYPDPLAADGSLHQFPVVGPADWRFLLPFVVYCAMAVYAIMRFRKKDFLSFGILYFLVTVSIVSNVIVMIGTNYGERLMYAPSLGILFCIAVLLDKIIQKSPDDKKDFSIAGFFRSVSRPLGITAIVVILFSIKTIARNADWHDDMTLYSADVKTVPNSVRMRFYLANKMTSSDYLETLSDSITRQQKMQEGIKELGNCIQLDPKYADAYQRRAYVNHQMKNYVAAEPDFLKALELNPTSSVTHNNYGGMLFATQRYPEAVEHFEKALAYNPYYADAAFNLANLHGVYGLGAQDQATKDPAHKDEHMTESKQQFETAIAYFLKTIQINPDYVAAYRLLSITYRNIGDQSNADKYAAQADRIDQAQKNRHAKN